MFGIKNLLAKRRERQAFDREHELCGYWTPRNATKLDLDATFAYIDEVAACERARSK